MATADFVVIGAGAAGVGAGLALQAAGLPFVILEAAGRVGGRAYTDTTSLPRLWDQGCHWLHCADVNPLVAWADRLGAHYDRQGREDSFEMWSNGGWLDQPDARAARGATDDAFDAVYAAAARGQDVAIADVLPHAGRWAPGVRNILQLMASEDPERVSSLGYGDYDDTHVNWPVVSGYGDLIGRMAAALPVRLGVKVKAVEQGVDDVRIETTQGTIVARAAIVTVSTNVLAAGAIRFGAGPAHDLLDLIADVPCGAYEKVAIALKRPLVARAETLFCMVDPGNGSSPLDFQVDGAGRDVMIAHMGGALARDLAADGPDTLRAFALERLSQAFGKDVLNEVTATAVTGWQGNPLVRGAYSYARPGCAARRHQMIAAETGRVAFAGEAFSRQWQATAHGAFQSGQDVAGRVLRDLARRRRG
jgi:monoamine oxidase